ncbi:MAG: hypothetical protein WKF78_01965 [Candidatus Limnocylindrales bacterium]
MPDDVVTTYAVQWDADHPLHKGRDNSFTYFPGLFGGFLNPPAPAAGWLVDASPPSEGRRQTAAPFAPSADGVPPPMERMSRLG